MWKLRTKLTHVKCERCGVHHLYFSTSKSKQIPACNISPNPEYIKSHSINHIDIIELYSQKIHQQTLKSVFRYLREKKCFKRFEENWEIEFQMKSNNIFNWPHKQYRSLWFNEIKKKLVQINASVSMNGSCSDIYEKQPFVYAGFRFSVFCFSSIFFSLWKLFRFLSKPKINDKFRCRYASIECHHWLCIIVGSLSCERAFNSDIVIRFATTLNYLLCHQVNVLNATYKPAKARHFVIFSSIWRRKSRKRLLQMLHFGSIRWPWCLLCIIKKQLESITNLQIIINKVFAFYFIQVGFTKTT